MAVEHLFEQGRAGTRKPGQQREPPRTEALTGRVPAAELLRRHVVDKFGEAAENVFGGAPFGRVTFELQAFAVANRIPGPIEVATAIEQVGQFGPGFRRHSRIVGGQFDKATQRGFRADCRRSVGATRGPKRARPGPAGARRPLPLALVRRRPPIGAAARASRPLKFDAGAWPRWSTPARSSRRPRGTFPSAGRFRRPRAEPWRRAANIAAACRLTRRPGRSSSTGNTPAPG